MQGQSARFKQTHFFQKQHGDELVPAALLLNHSLWDRDGDKLHKL